MISSRRSGPAADAGEAWPTVIVPDGVTRVISRTMSSKRPYPAEFWPDDLVTAYPPMVA